MNRNELLQVYNVNEYGLITDPGRFEGEPLFAPYFYDQVLSGWGEPLDWADSSTTDVVYVEPHDCIEFPELRDNKVVAVHVTVADTGFVSCEQLTQEELDELLEDCAASVHIPEDEYPA